MPAQGAVAAALRQALHEIKDTLLPPPILESFFKLTGGPAPALH